MATEAERGGTEQYGNYVNAEDVLGEDGEEEGGTEGEEEEEENTGEGEGEDARHEGADKTGQQEKSSLELLEEERPRSSSMEEQAAAPHGAGPLDRPPSGPAPEAPTEGQHLVLPPATARSSTSRESARRSSHQEASTSSPNPPQSAGSLPPINLRNSAQSSRKGSDASSPKGAGGRGQAAGAQLGPSRSSTGTSRYYQAPPSPPPPPKPKPRERHDVSAVDPVYLQTAVYRTVPGVGRMYDWSLQHEVNQAVSKQRKQQAQMGKVMEAARLQLQVREANERAFQQWLATKKAEKQQQYVENRRIAYVTSVYRSLAQEDPEETRAREASWVGNFSSALAAPSGRHAPRGQDSGTLERFRL